MPRYIFQAARARWQAILAVGMAAVAVGTPAAQAATAPVLEVKGNSIVSGKYFKSPFVPRGVNFMSFEYACTGGGSGSDRYAYGATAATAQAIAKWHVNTVRIPLNQDCWLGDDGYPKSVGATAGGYQAAVAEFVTLLHGQGLAVILDLHWSGPTGAWADSPPKNPAERGQKAMADERSSSFWSSVAQQFKTDRAVMFEAFNEPESLHGCVLDWAKWLNGGCTDKGQNQDGSSYEFKTIGMQNLINAIRAAGAPQPILLGGLNSSNDLKGWPVALLKDRPATRIWPVDWTRQLVASFHTYPGQACSDVGCWGQSVKALATQVPVITTEVGDMCGDGCGPDHIKKYMAWADAQSPAIGYLAWGWNVNGGNESVVDPSGNAQNPNGVALKGHLAQLYALGKL